jgi:pantoate--beta-alanine ligase
MIIFKHEKDIKSYLPGSIESKKIIGFVPTMGALHQGHVSLLENCKETCDVTVCSIFVNPTQFNNPDDLKKYPVTIEKDIYLLEKNGCDILFLPGVNEIYPEGVESKIHFELGDLETILEGKYRPGHFQGVCQVVKRLLEIINPSHLFIGQKDYQQCMVLKKLLQIMNSKIELIICPTLRDENGLAMSSRNLRLNDEEKKKAAEIYKTLQFIKQNIKNISLEKLKTEAEDHLISKNFKVDYIEIANADNLKVIDQINNDHNLIAIIAAYINDVRLIDNLLLT